MLLLFDDFVYKVKKPVYFDFLDYSTLKNRRVYSIVENELNKRFTNNVYAGVYKIAKEDDKYTLVPFISSLPAIEYVLKMRRIPDSEFLKTKVENNDIDPEAMIKVGEDIAIQLRDTHISQPVVDGYEVSCDLVTKNIDDNFLFIYKQQLSDDTKEKIDYIKSKTYDFIENNREIFSDRLKDGYIKDGHGDLRIGHVYIENDLAHVIDCTEFSQKFRTNDVVSEAAFLSVELDFRSKIEHSDNFVQGFLNIFNDDNSKKLLNFYRCYRAMVKAKVTALEVSNVSAEEPTYADHMQSFNKYINMAYIYATAMESTYTMVFCGMIASGKTTHASLFCRDFPVSLISTDETRKKLEGFKIDSNHVSAYNEGIYQPEVTLQVYKNIYKYTLNKMSLCRINIIDGSFLYTEEQELFDELDTIFICFDAPIEVIRERLKKREGNSSISDGREIHLSEILKNSKLKSDLLINTTNNLKNNIKIILKYLKRR